MKRNTKGVATFSVDLQISGEQSINLQVSDSWSKYRAKRHKIKLWSSRSICHSAAKPVVRVRRVQRANSNLLFRHG
jgi:hypothetical protein